MKGYDSPKKMKYDLKYTEEDYINKYTSNDYFKFAITNDQNIKLCVNIEHIANKFLYLNNLDKIFNTLKTEGYEPHINAISEIRGSLSVEGIHSSKKIIEGIAKKNSLKDEKEQSIYNIFKAYEMISELEINKDTIKAVYETLMNNIDLEDNSLDGDFYRKGEVEIGTVARGVSAKLVESKMDELIEFINTDLASINSVGLNKTISLFVYNSLIHYQLVYIHPYYDGNGRMARLIAQWHSNKISEVFNYIPISELISYDKNNYYEAIQNVRESYNSMDATYFVDYILDKTILYVNTELLLRKITQELQNNLEVLTETEKAYIKIIYLSGLCNGKFGYKDFNATLKLSDEEKTKQGIFKILNNLVSKGILNEYLAKDNKTKFYDVIFKLDASL